MKEAILAENFAMLSSPLRRLAECLPAHLDALCSAVTDFAEPAGVHAGRRTVTDDGLAYAFDTVAGAVTGELEKIMNLSSPLPTPVRPFYDMLVSSLRSVAAAFAAVLLADRVTLAEGPSPLTGRSRVAYFRNAYSDLAERRFARLLPDPTVAYFNDFSALCEELAAERADYIILPVASTADGRLGGIERRILRYGLCPVAYTDIAVAGDDRMTFGLFAAEPKAPAGADCAELFAFCDDDAGLSFLLSAADALGCTLHDCTRMPDERDYQTTYRLVLGFTRPGESPEEAARRLRALRICLATSFPHHLLTGLTCRLAD